MIRRTFRCVLSFLLSPMLMAQQVATFDAQNPSSPGSREITLSRKIVIPLILLESVSSATARKGDKVQIAVAEDVQIDGVVLMPKGTLGSAIVSRTRKAIPGKRDGEVRLKPAELTLPSGKTITLKEYVPSGGEEVCEGFASCAALTAIVIVLLPIAIVGSLVSDFRNHRGENGEELRLGRCTRLWAHPAAATHIPVAPETTRFFVNFSGTEQDPCKF